MTFENGEGVCSAQISPEWCDRTFLFSVKSFRRFQLNRKGKTWRDSFLVERGYVLLIDLSEHMFSVKGLSVGDITPLRLGWLGEKD